MGRGGGGGGTATKAFLPGAVLCWFVACHLLQLLHLFIGRAVSVITLTTDKVYYFIKETCDEDTDGDQESAITNTHLLQIATPATRR